MEVVFRALFIFVFLWVVTRVVGRQTLGELSTFQLVLYVTMGDLVQQGVTQQDYSVTGAVLAVSTMALLTIGIGYVSYRFPSTRPIAHGLPTIIVSDGEVNHETMRRERVSLDQLMEAAREQGVEKFSDLKLAVLEPNGKISFFQKDQQAESGAPETANAG
jgi:uncharacterized membrane protein YcaP (DUF421 family)